LSEQRIVVIGASAGGVEALLATVPEIPADFPAPIFLVVHVPAESPSLLSQILRRRAKIAVEDAVDGARWRKGVLYVATPDRHLTLEDGVIRSTRGPRENRHRPAIDPLFRSAALHFGAATIGVVLTGSLDDGTGGAVTIKKRGGMVIVQDPREALFPSMPASVLEHAEADAIVTLGDLVPTLVRLVHAPVPKRAAPRSRDLSVEVRMATLDPEAMNEQDRPGTPSPYSCPDCGGVLWEIDDAGQFTRFRCRVGHAFSPESMISAQGEVLEEALWTAVKTLEETVRLSHRLADQERMRGHEWMAARFQEKEQAARERAETIRRVLTRPDVVPVENNEDQAAKM
jgi:two-component system chemotaxis response regulator CheB